MPDQNGSKNGKPASDEAWRIKWIKQWNADHSRGSNDRAQPGKATATVAPASAPQTKQANPTGAVASGHTEKAVPAATTAGPHMDQAVPTATATTPQTQPAVATAPAGSPRPAAKAAIAASPSVQPAVSKTSTTVAGWDVEKFGTRSDPIVNSTSMTADGKAITFAKDNPLATAGDGGRLLLYLAPMLLVVVGSLHLIRRFYSRTGRLPGSLEAATRLKQRPGGSHGADVNRPNRDIVSALVGFFRRQNSGKNSQSAIHLIETLPMGYAQIHLVEVRGRVLLLGATTSSLNLLTEFEQDRSAGSDDFRDLLHAAAADMEALDYSEPDMPATATVSALEDLIRETDQAVSRRSRRLRTVNEIDVEVEGENA